MVLLIRVEEIGESFHGARIGNRTPDGVRLPGPSIGVVESARVHLRVVGMNHVPCHALPVGEKALDDTPHEIILVVAQSAMTSRGVAHRDDHAFGEHSRHHAVVVHEALERQGVLREVFRPDIV